jgi:serine protease Do
MRRVVLTLVLIALGFVAGTLVTGRMQTLEPAPAAQASATIAPATQAPSPRPGGPPDFTDVAARTIAGVTNISAVQVVRRSASPFANDPFFRYFFGDDPDLFGGRSRREASLGSGVIVSPDGYILTNQHVVGQGTEIMVVLADKRELAARIVGVDQWTDIALLKIDATGLPTVPWGDSSSLKVADWVLAIGNPFQLSQTVTLGIISAVGRANVGIATYEDFIQTDAAINPGNSGGALINARGELVGINTAIFSQSGGYQGIGFAVPSNLARRVMQDLIEYGEVRRGSIGYLEVAPLTTQLAEQLGVADGRGALVQRMRRDSSAYEAGIRPGDIIVGYNGQDVEDPGHFLRLVSDTPIDSEAELEIIRDGRRVDVEVPVSQAPRPSRR